MFAFCTDPKSLEGAAWFACYLTSGTHLAMYASVGTVMLLLALAAPAAMVFGFAGALAARSRVVPLALVGQGYIAMIRGVPDIVFFLFVPIAVDQGLEYLRHVTLCPDWTEPVRRGADFVVCAEAKLPRASAPAWVHDTYAFLLALLAFALVFGAFAANTLRGAMEAVPRAQVETAESYGMTRGQAFRRVILPQMWVYALPGLTNLWMILVKATPLLFLLGIKDVVYWARELGGSKTQVFAYPHPDWRVYYFGALLLFYLLLTWASERVFARLSDRLARGQATAAGEAMR
ncbi:MAG: ABC transporter permease, partial [Gemmobacter sp.]